MQQIETLKKLVKQKDKDLQQLKVTFDAIKLESIRVNQEKENKTSEIQLQMDKVSGEKSRIESQMNQAINSISSLKQQLN